MPSDPTIYVCSQEPEESKGFIKASKFEIIMNAPPSSVSSPSKEEEFKLCQKRTFENLKKMGLIFDPMPSMEALTTPQEFNNLFPGSDGSLYGLNPHQLMTTFKRPQAQTKIRGLYLAGGGVHPGPGIPMALLSGRHAAAAIEKDQTLT
jgi:1-hydroxycarotenoid 3,4-desaturase